MNEEDTQEPTDEMQKLADAAEGLWKDGALLHMIRMMNTRRRIPAMMEFEVPETSPYLITSSTALFWIPTSRGGRIRAGVRPKSSTAAFFGEVVDEVVKQGQESKWGNIHPLTKDGLSEAIGHVHYYMADDSDNSNLLILVHPDFEWAKLDPEWVVKDGHFLARIMGVPVAKAEWLDTDTAVVIPYNRGMVGFAIEIGEENILAVIHNASRGIGVARGSVAE